MHQRVLGQEDGRSQSLLVLEDILFAATHDWRLISGWSVSGSLPRKSKKSSACSHFQNPATISPSESRLHVFIGTFVYRLDSGPGVLDAYLCCKLDRGACSGHGTVPGEGWEIKEGLKQLQDPLLSLRLQSSSPNKAGNNGRLVP